jgi:putative hydrolase of HD superfamily
MNKIHQFRIFNKLKSVYRFSSVDSRKESSAEHSWSALVLADFFLSQGNYNLDRLKIYELLMYHDVVEIEAGDTPLHPEINSAGKKDRERAAAESLENKLPEPLNRKFKKLFQEFEEGATIEARFANAIDALDADIHELDYKEDWKGWTKEFTLQKRAPLFVGFPELKDAFEAILNYLVEEKYFD